jgi:hypothetical protein
VSLDHETTTEKQGGKRTTTAARVTDSPSSELARQSMPNGGLASGGDVTAMFAGDLGSRSRVLTQLQQTAGNTAAAASVGVQRSPRGGSPRNDTVMRSPDADTTYNVTEEVGPVAGSDYTVEADSLAAFADAVMARDEAGRVQWDPSFAHESEGGDAPSVTVSVTCPIALEMPSWALPADMGPNTRAEFNRWLGALRTHEQGHIDRVHQHFDGLAQRLAEMSYASALGLFNTTKTNLQTASDGYDTETSHGISQGTTIGLSIEEAERAESEGDETE